MNGAGARRKGHGFERSMVAEFATVFGSDVVRRGLQYRDDEIEMQKLEPGWKQILPRW